VTNPPELQLFDYTMDAPTTDVADEAPPEGGEGRESEVPVKKVEEKPPISVTLRFCIHNAEINIFYIEHFVKVYIR